MQPQNQTLDGWDEPSLLNEPPVYDLRTFTGGIPTGVTTANANTNTNTLDSVRNWFADTFNPFAKEGELTLGDVMKNPRLAFTPNAAGSGTGTNPTAAASKAAQSAKSTKSNGGTGSAKVVENDIRSTVITATPKAGTENNIGFFSKNTNAWSNFYGK